MLQESEEGEYVVTSPLDPQLIKEPEKIAEAFENTRDYGEGNCERYL